MPGDHEPNELLSSTRLHNVDSVCKSFQAKWQAGSRPRIEDYLRMLGADQRGPLLRELILLDVEYRQQSGETPTPQDYQSQHPDYEHVVRSVFDQETVDWSQGSTNRKSPAPAGDQPPVQKKFNRFEIQSKLGQGGFGTVYRAHDPQLDREVALKLPRPGTIVDEEDAQRFLREARAAAQLRHPNIVPVHDAGAAAGTYYIASQYVEGKSLRDEVSEQGKYLPRKAARLICKLASALHYAHIKGIIHRDVKPENVIIDAAGEPHVMDFGLARRDEGEALQTQAGVQLGTPAYMSPEQAKGESHLADARSDLWSLGVMLYELLSGQRPFSGRGEELRGKILNSEPTSPRKLDCGVPKDLETICLKCLAKDPERRYSSTQHLADDLTRWLEYRPILARRISPVVRLGKWVRRNPLPSAGIAVAATLCAGFFVYWQTRPAYWDVRVTPADAVVQLDGEPIALKDGQALVKQSHGRHVFEISKQGFETQRQDVGLVRGESFRTNIELQSLSGSVSVTSEPEGAAVELRNSEGETVKAGYTPFQSEDVASGDYQLSLSKDAYLSYEQPVRIPKGGRVVRLEPIRLEVAVEGAQSFEDLRQIREKLAELGDGREHVFNRTPLREVLESIGQAWGIPILLDSLALHNASIGEDTPITKTIPNVTLETALKLVLSDPRLTFRPEVSRRGNRQEYTLRVTTQDRANSTLRNIMHPVGDLTHGIFGTIQGNSIVSQVQGTIQPAAWSRYGGPGTMQYLPAANTLLVSHSWRVHMAIDEYLNELRRTRTANADFIAKLEADLAIPTGDAQTPSITPAGEEITLSSRIPAIQLSGAYYHRLANRPDEHLKKEPEYASTPAYGAIRLGAGNDTSFSFAVDEQADGTMRFFVDGNNDEDLTNDNDYVLESRFDSRSRRWFVTAVCEAQYSNRNMPYQVQLSCDRSLQTYGLQSDTTRVGRIKLNGSAYDFVVLDTNCDGRFDDLINCRLLIDVDRNGGFDGPSKASPFYESYSLLDRANVNNVVIEATSLDPSGTSLRIKRSNLAVDPKTETVLGAPAPDFEGQDFEGNSVRLSELRGKHVLLHFWSSWVPDLKTHVQHIRNFKKKYQADDDVIVVGVALDADKSEAQAAAMANGLNHRHLFHGGHWRENPATRLWNLKALPTFVLVDKSGDVAANVQDNPNTLASLPGLLDRALRDTIGWNTSKSLFRRLEGHEKEVNIAVYSRDGTQVLSGSGDKTVRLWHALSGRLVRTFEGHSDQVVDVAFSPNGKTIASAGQDGSVLLWDSESGEQLAKCPLPARYLAFIGTSNDRLLLGGIGNDLSIWERGSDEALLTLSGHEAPVSSLVVSSDGRRALSSGWTDRSVRLWDLATGEPIQVFQLQARTRGVAFSVDPKVAACGADDFTVKLLDLETGEVLREFAGHEGPIRDVRFGRRGRRLVSVTMGVLKNRAYQGDQSVRIWDVSTGTELQRFVPNSGSLRSIDISPNGIWAITAQGNRRISVWRLPR